MGDLTGFYQSNIDRYELAIKSIRKQLFLVAVLRLVAFTGFGVFVYLFMLRQQTLFAILSIVSLAFFLWFVKRSTTLNSKRQVNENLLFINKNEQEHG